MTQVTLEAAQANLVELIARLLPGETVLITRNEQPVARLVIEEPPPRHPRKAGSAKGRLFILQDDEHPEDFKEYLP